MGTAEWCTCTDINSGYVNIQHPVAGITEGQAWVHGSCLKPSFEWWKAHEKYCDECGRSFSSPVDDLCTQCGGRSWADVADDYRQKHREMSAKALTPPPNRGLMEPVGQP